MNPEKVMDQKTGKDTGTDDDDPEQFFAVLFLQGTDAFDDQAPSFNETDGVREPDRGNPDQAQSPGTDTAFPVLVKGDQGDEDV